MKNAFEERLVRAKVRFIKKQKYVLWILTDAIFIRTRRQGYSVHLYVDTDAYLVLKKFYGDVDFNCPTNKFLLNIIGFKPDDDSTPNII